MTKEDAIMEQKLLQIKGFNLGHWFGTNCTKCCDVYPRFKHRFENGKELGLYECPVCGKHTAGETMPWISAEAWNSGKYESCTVQQSFL